MMLIDVDWQPVLPDLEMVLGFRGQEKSLIIPIRAVYSLSPNYSEEAVNSTCLNTFIRLKNRVCSVSFDVSCMFSEG